MMNNFSFSGFGFELHWFFMVVTFLGFIALVIWMVKYMTKKDLFKLLYIALIVGIVGSLLTSSFSMRTRYQMMNYSSFPASQKLMNHMWEEWGKVSTSNTSFEDMMKEMDEHVEKMIRYSK